MGTNIATSTEEFFTSDKSWIGVRLGLCEMRSGTLDVSQFPVGCVVNGKIPSGTPVAKLDAGSKFGPYRPSRSELQSLVATGGSAGDFTLTFDGEETDDIDYNATKDDVLAALEALSNIDPGDIVVEGGPLPETPVTIMFVGQFVGTDVPALVVTDNVTDGNAVISTVAGGGDVDSGLQNFAGLLFDDVKVVNLATDPDVGFALFWLGVVKTAKLPAFTMTEADVDNGFVDGATATLDEAARASATHIRFED